MFTPVFIQGLLSVEILAGLDAVVRNRDGNILTSRKEKMRNFVYLTLACLYLYQTVTAKDPIFFTKYGNVRGSLMKSRANKSFAAFRGIPYAKPPVGELRFRAPVPPNPWNDIYNATGDSSICIQQNYLFSAQPQVEGSEDCLYLNVYTPKLRRQIRHGDILYPVMVFIHYGAYMAGSSRSDLLGPQYFLDEDVVLVTFNYRLGVFGFLSTYDDAAPGNWAYKDQTAALRWVRDNIIYFGGSNKRVTIFGQSAGAGSTHHHILSPLSRGLFQAAISQSGSALALWAKPQTNLSAEIAKAQGLFVGCNQTDSYSLLECLRDVPAEQLVLSSELFRIMRSEPLTVYGPTIERKSKTNPEPFITKSPLEIINNREFSNVPWIIGIVSDEGILRAAPLVRQKDLLEQINANFDTYMPQMMALVQSVPQDQVAEIWNEIRNFYFPDGDITASNSRSIQGLIDLYSDRAFAYPAYQSALLHAWKGHRPIWFYYFDYKGKLTYGDLFAATNATVDFDWGVSHCDDLLYLFPSPKLLPQLPKEDLEMSRILISMFTTFARCRNPNFGGVLKRSRSWDPIPDVSGNTEVQNVDLHHLKISGPYREGNRSVVRLEMLRDFLPERMFLWERLPLFENVEGLH